MLLLSAGLAIALGTGVYLFDRDWGGVLFLAPFAGWQPLHGGLFGVLGGALPSLTHAYAFSVLIILALWPTAHARRAGAAAWLPAALALECLQTAAAKEAVAGLAARVDGLPMGNSAIAYIVNGRFDANDLLAATLGVSIAYAASSVLERGS